jgi:hypothetical protein
MNRERRFESRRALAALLVVFASGLGAASCAPPRLAIVSPADKTQAPASGDLSIQIDLGAPLAAGGSVHANLVRGIDGTSKSILPVALAVADASATASLGAAQLVPGRNSLFVSVDRDGDGRPEATVSTTFSWEPEIDVTDAERCDWLDPKKCLFPFPNDHFTGTDPTADTGLRLNFALASMPARYDGVHTDPTELNRNDGFSPGAELITHVEGIDLAKTGAAPITKIARSLESDTPIALVDADTGERRLLWLEADPRAAGVILGRPGQNLENGHRYIVALRRLKNAAGDTLPAKRPFQVYRDKIPTYLPAVEARRPKMEAMFANLARAGIGREDLFLAWEFTVISTRDMSERLIHMRDDAFASLGGAAPSFTVTRNEAFTSSTDADPNALFRRVDGTFRVPLYLTNGGVPGSRLRPGPGGLPERDPSQDFVANFRCTIPATASADHPARIVLYGHGLLGDEDEVAARNIRDITTKYDFVYCATRWSGMADEDTNNVYNILADLSLFPTIADRLHQGFLNFLFLGRAMKHPQGFVANPAFQDAEGRPIVDPGELFYDGNSQGGIAGGGLAAYAQDYTRAVLGVTGMNYSTLLLRSVDFDDFFTLLSITYPDPYDTSLNIALLQLLWDRVEANGGASHITRDTYPGTPPKKILLHVAFGDHQVANVTAEVEARTIGARIHQPALAPGRHADEQLPDDPTNRAYFGIDPLPNGPYDGSALVLWDSGTPTPPTDVIPPRPAAGFGRDPHETPRRDPEAQLQKSEFLKTGGAVIDVCNGQPCTAVDP